MHLREIEGIVRESDDLRLKIIRDLGSFTVTLFAVFDSHEGDLLRLAGTGTLMAVGGSHYVLTAAHVWEDVLKSSVKVGITLTDNIDHRFLMDAETIVPFGPPKPSMWSEWGPDITFLRVPSEHVGAINAYKVFYSPAIDGRSALDVDHLELRVLMGTPQAFGQFTQTHADLQICGFFMQPDAPCQSRDNFDYFGLEVDMSFPGTPRNFGGVSGGGLWKVLIHDSSSTGEIDWVRSLEGVAFYQSAIDDGRRLIHCHGPESIRAAMPSS